jgi:hypothetical protein
MRASFVAVLIGALTGMLGVHESRASTIEGINHTHWAINRFSVEGRSGIDIIGPYQGVEEGAVIARQSGGCRG